MPTSLFNTYTLTHWPVFTDLNCTDTKTMAKAKFERRETTDLTTTTSPQSSSSSSSSPSSTSSSANITNGLTKGAIIGVVVGSILFVVALLGAFVFLYRKHHRRGVGASSSSLSGGRKLSRNGRHDHHHHHHPSHQHHTSHKRTQHSVGSISSIGSWGSPSDDIGKIKLGAPRGGSGDIIKKDKALYDEYGYGYGFGYHGKSGDGDDRSIATTSVGGDTLVSNNGTLNANAEIFPSPFSVFYSILVFFFRFT